MANQNKKGKNSVTDQQHVNSCNSSMIQASISIPFQFCIEKLMGLSIPF
jgi:hypothetical protein